MERGLCSNWSFFSVLIDGAVAQGVGGFGHIFFFKYKFPSGGGHVVLLDL